MLASKFRLDSSNSVSVLYAPDEVRARPGGVVDQAVPVAQLLTALNVILCGKPVGPCRWMAVFNHEEPAA